MKYTVTVPDLAIASCTLTEWRKEIGDYVAAGDVLAICGEAEVSSPAFGILNRKYAQPGQAVEAGEPLALLAGVPEPLVTETSRLPDTFAVRPPSLPIGPEEISPLTPRAQVIAQALSRATAHVPHIFTSTTVDMSEVARLAQRTQIPPLLFLAHVVASALSQYPELNSELVDTSTVRRKRYVHLAVRFQRAGTTFAPVLRDADRRSLRSLAGEWQDLCSAADANQLPPESARGATFTISETSAAVLQSPLLHLPQVGHLRIGGMEPRPVALSDSTLVVRPVAALCLAHDARIVPDETAAAFLSEVRTGLEEARFLFA